MAGKMSLPKLTPKPTRRLTPEEAMNQVFSNDLLLESILERAIRSNDGFGETPSEKATFTLKDVLNLRLVCKSWNEVVTKLHRKAKKSLFYIPLTHDNTTSLIIYPNDDDDDEKPILEMFLESMAYWGYTEENSKLPPFHLELCPDFFRSANGAVYSALFQFIQTYCPNSMTQFTFNFHRNKFDYIPLLDSVENFNLPMLRHAKLVIERMAWSYIPFIQKILSSAPNLDSLDIVSTSCVVNFSIPHLTSVIEAIARSHPYVINLPSKLSKMNLYGTVDSCSCFYSIPMDNLRDLKTLTVSASACMRKKIDDMFLPIADHLHHLNFVGFISCIYLFNRHYRVSMPPMKSLQSLTIAMPWEMESGVKMDYQTHLPSLVELTVVHHDDRVFTALFQRQSSNTIKRCTVVGVQPHNYPDQGFRGSSQRIDATRVNTVEAIKEAFPNLTHLGVSVSGSDCSNLRYIFENIPHLKSLAIFVETYERFKTTVNWDSLFTGLTDYMCDKEKQSVTKAGFRQIISAMNECRVPSIRFLQNLEALYIIETTYPTCRAYLFGPNAPPATHGVCDFETETLPCVSAHRFSEISFNYSFFDMKNLKRLAFTKGFMPSELIQNKWFLEKGTRIKTFRAPKLYHLLTAQFSMSDAAWYQDQDQEEL